MMSRRFLAALTALLTLPAWATYPRTVEFRSLDEQPVAGATIYYRAFTGRLYSVHFGPTGCTETVLTTDAQGRVQLDQDIPEHVDWVFGSDYALVLAQGYMPQIAKPGDLQNRVYLRPIAYHQLTLTLPDGTPAAGATFLITAIGGRIHLLNDMVSGISTPAFIFTADQRGIVSLPCFRQATTKDGTTGVFINGVAFTAGYVNEAVSLQTMEPGNFSVSLKPAQQLQGVVTDATGRAIAGARVRCAEFPLPAVATDAQGRFTLGALPTSVPTKRIAGRDVPGTLTVYIDAPGYARQGISLLPTNAANDPCRIALEPLVTVTGKLVDRTTGQPVTNSRKYGYYLLVRHDLGPQSAGRVTSTYLVTNLDGTFTAAIPPHARLEVTNGPAGDVRDYHDGDTITLQAASR